MYEVIVLSSDNDRDCPFYKFDNWTCACNFIELNLLQGWSCQVNYFEIPQSEVNDNEQ